jgi:3-deoxy-manno-octulosonate cytidylyltransferase (CMP-KDO synthetase)
MVACIIPARLNSSRFPRKLLACVEGKTVLQHTFRCALQAKKIDQLFVATDSEEIAEHVHLFGGAVIWTSSSCPTGTDRIAEAAQKEPKLKNVSIIINLQGDHPLTASTTLDRIVELLLLDPSVSVATAARPLRTWEEYYAPQVVKCVMDRCHNALYFSRSPIPHQKKLSPIPFGYLHIGIYGYKASFLREIASLPKSDLQSREDLEQLRVLETGHSIKIAVVEEEALGIDLPEDLERFKSLVWNKK